MSEATRIGASLAETWSHYFEARGWPLWVDQFGGVESSDGDYPQAGATLRWRSVQAGRGAVLERVLEHEPRRRHRISFEDPQTTGELVTSFEIDGDSTLVTQELRYSLRRGGPFAWITDVLFVRSQQRRSLQRSLLRLKHEVEELAAAPDAEAR